MVSYIVRRLSYRAVLVVIGIVVGAIASIDWHELGHVLGFVADH